MLPWRVPPAACYSLIGIFLKVTGRGVGSAVWPPFLWVLGPGQHHRHPPAPPHPTPPTLPPTQTRNANDTFCAAVGNMLNMLAC